MHLNRYALCRTAALFGVVSLSLISAAQNVAPRRVLIKFLPGTSSQSINAALASENASSIGEIQRLGIKIIQVPVGAEAKVAKALAHRREVQFAEPDYMVKPDYTPNDPSFASQWHLNKIGASSAWGLTLGSPSVIVAIIDSGCDPTHPDLKNQYVPGWNIYSNTADTADVFGHGTAVAGCAAAQMNNGVGISGIGGNCKIMPMRVTDTTGYAYGSAIANAMIWAADHGARVANASFSLTYSASVSAGAQYFQSKGGVVTMSSGNTATLDPTPENPYILTVGATDQNDALTTFSSPANCIDLSAPGINIYTTTRGGGYGNWWGTSFSAPLTAGTAALMIAANPALTPAQIQDGLKSSTDDKGAIGWDTQFGAGRLNAYKAVSKALSTGGSVDIIPPSANFINPGDAMSLLGSVTVQVGASDNVGVGTVSLYVDGVAVGTSSAGPYNFNWNTQNAVNGTHNLRADVRDLAGNLTTDYLGQAITGDFNVYGGVYAVCNAPGDTTSGSTIVFDGPTANGSPRIVLNGSLLADSVNFNGNCKIVYNPASNPADPVGAGRISGGYSDGG